MVSIATLQALLIARQIVRETIGTALYFMTYESGKQLLVKYQGVDSPVSPLAVALSGGFCGMISLVSV